MGDGNAVVGKWHARVGGGFPAVVHLPAVEHAAPAVDDQLVGGQILGEVPAGGVLQPQVFAGVLPQPPGDFHRADVLALAVVGAALGDEHPVPVLQPVDGGHAPDSILQKALIAGHQNGEGGQGDVLWGVPVHLGKGLAVGDDHAGLDRQLFQSGGQGVFLHHNGGAVRVQHVPDGLLLGQNQPALGRGTVNGGDKDHQVPGGEQVAHQALVLPLRAGQPGNALL